MLNKFGHCFSAAVQAQGEVLFRQGLAREIYGSAEVSQVEILAASGAEVGWRVTRNRLVPSCSCKTFQEGKLCPHLWAALLLANRQATLGKAMRKCVSAKIRLDDDSPVGDSTEPRYQLEGQFAPTRRGAPPAKLPEDDTAEQRELQVMPRKERPPVVVTPLLNPALASPEILYVLAEEKLCPEEDFVWLETWWKQHRPDGKANYLPFYPESGSTVSDNTDFKMLALLLRHSLAMPGTRGNVFAVHKKDLREFFDLLVESAHLRWAPRLPGKRRLHKLRIPRHFSASLKFSFEHISHGQYEIQATLQTAERLFSFAEIVYLGLGGVAVADGCLYQLSFAGAEKLALELWQAARQNKKPQARTYNEAVGIARGLFLTSTPQDASWPEELRCQICQPAPKGMLFVKTAEFKFAGKEQLHADLNFEYEGKRCLDTDLQARLPGQSLNQVLERDFTAENRLRERLLELGFNPERKGVSGYRLLPAKLEAAVLTLVMEDWLVTAAGKTYCKPGDKKASIKGAGLDWFEINGEVDFNGQKISLPKLLQTLQRGANCVRLDDGTYGILPKEWLEKFTVLTEIGETSAKRILLQRRQAAVVEALLAERLQDADGQFTAVAAALRQQAVPQAKLPPEGFRGTLRSYQADGLGWLMAMRDLGLGVCLADDMGLGKTVQVLALLAWQKKAPTAGPALVVAPKSLLFNWQSEAEHFAPSLRCVIYTGSGREQILSHLDEVDLLLTTYGTLRQDAELLAACPFDYCILDESQAIKNADSATAKAVRTIKASHRLAMTGTPIENRLAELFSQLEFLNPGLFGDKFLASFSKLSFSLTDEQIFRLQKAVRPFLLRRTKGDVAKDLPVKTEQVLFCVLDEAQQQSYDELKVFYRNELLLAQASGGPAQIKTLVALLRLRQAACHPGLLDPQLTSQPYAKLEVLLERLGTLAEAGQKALIFSQFSKFLRLLEPHLRQLGMKYCYLDGQTQNRGELVQQFQEDPQTLFFLISLKAGGVGLNLTAAEYVFILDPWWNPAAESQAIDRAYRIGQKKAVFAYRLIARNTVEEKVLQMQEAKRRLAATVLEAVPKRGPALQLADLEFLLE